MRWITSFKASLLTVAQNRSPSMNCTKFIASRDCGLILKYMASTSPELKSPSHKSCESLHVQMHSLCLTVLINALGIISHAEV
jgi:hypothetical protein